ncbi:MAG: hypothetical protein ACLUMO_02855 [Lachnospiraceae bacterium]
MVLTIYCDAVTQGDFCKKPEKTHRSSAEIPVNSMEFIDFAMDFCC